MSRTSKAARRKPPSRVKFERSHPTISCRVSLETYNLLNKGRQEEGWSFADMLRAGLGGLRTESRRLEEIRDRAYRQGYREAETRFKVAYACWACGKLIAIESREAKQSAAQYMRDHGWAHVECLKTSGHASP